MDDFPPTQLFHLWQKIISFSKTPPYRETQKSGNFPKIDKNLPECLMSENAKIAKSLVIWWVWETRKFLNPKRGRGTPIFPLAQTGLLDAVKIKTFHPPQASAVRRESIFPENPNRGGMS